MRKLLAPGLALFFLAGSWLSCKDTTTSEKADLDLYRLQGDSIVQKTFDSLRTLLFRTLQQEGPEAAIRFCRAEALPLTSTWASAGTRVQRVADRYRNPANALDSLDRVQWENYLQSLKRKDSLQPVVFKRGHTVHYYKPILLQAPCVICHGDPATEITAGVKKVIDSLYPGDKATGFKPGELRGMWHLRFEKTE